MPTLDDRADADAGCARFVDGQFHGLHCAEVSESTVVVYDAKRGAFAGDLDFRARIGVAR